MSRQTLRKDEEEILGWLWALEASPRFVVPGPECSKGYVSLKVLQGLYLCTETKGGECPDPSSFSRSIIELERQGFVKTQRRLGSSEGPGKRTYQDPDKTEIQLSQEGSRVAKSCVRRPMKRFITINRKVYREAVTFFWRYFWKPKKKREKAESSHEEGTVP